MLVTKDKVKHKNFELNLVTKEGFLDNLNEDQKYWLLYKAMRELGKNLEWIDELQVLSQSQRAAILSPLDQTIAEYSDSELMISNQEVMQDWEYSLMHNLANIVTSKGGDILEVGFGMGISASKILENGVNSYTVIECNPTVISKFNLWKKNYPNININLIEGRWQDVSSQLNEYDGVIFDAYPVDEKDWFENALDSCSYAEQFFKIASACLKEGGVFTYYTGEVDSISNEHQRQLFKYFSQLNISVQSNLFPPKDCSYWWNNSMAVVAAYK